MQKRTALSHTNFPQFHTLRTLVICVGLFVVPVISHASVLISEVAWMGTDEDANNEWIELYNLSGTEADLTGWILTDGDSLSVTLAGTITPHGVAVLERTDDDTIPGTALMTYTGALSNTGGTLTLRNAEGGISDQAVGGDSWSGIGGSNTVPKKTAQRTRTGAWVTGAPTPYADNVQEDVPVVEDETTDEVVTETETTVTRSSNSGGGSSSKKKSEQKESNKPELTLSVRAPKIVYVNQEVQFEVTPSGIGETLMKSLVYAWNFGDTYTAGTRKTSHTFAYPGEYVVVVDAVFAKQQALARHEVTVLPVLLELGRTPQGDVQLRNTAKHEVDLGGFVVHGSKSFTFPKYTFIKAGGVLIVPKDRVGAYASNIALLDTQKVVVASYGQKVSVPQTYLTQGSIKQEYNDIDPVENLEQQEVASTANVEAQKTESGTIQIGNREVKERGVLAQFFNRVRGFFGL
ncbi:MAG: lamin tail domain-containing protein [Candidatus Kaiserbacteria bacterium]|nr:lamin tail domain-containing protein [Candidatus Kaiserbacteria bacterium]